MTMDEPVVARLQQLMNLREEVETLAENDAWEPAADWHDLGTHLALLLDIPGINSDSLELHETGDTVTVSGEREEVPDKLSGDRPMGMFKRTLIFPEEVLPNTGDAQLKAGVLTIRFRKKHPTIDVSSQQIDQSEHEE